MPILKEYLGIAAEYAVASELCRRGIYAQLTFGNRKRTDILVMTQNGDFLRLEVKAKQDKAWPNCKGISGKNVFLVLVDYADRDAKERPDFYVLGSGDWRNLVRRIVKETKEKTPKVRIEINGENCPIFLDQITKSGHPYKGLSFGARRVQEHREKWDKIVGALTSG